MSVDFALHSSFAKLPSGGRIAVHPVTVAQMRQFYDARGYQDDSLWLPFGRRLCDPNQRYPRVPRWLNPRDYQNSWPLSDLSNPASPVLPVYWDEALAYCNWVSRKLHRTFDLPSIEMLREALGRNLVQKEEFDEWTGMLDDGFHVSDQRRYDGSGEASVKGRDWVENTDFVIATLNGGDRRPSATIEGKTIGFRLAETTIVAAPDVHLVDITPQLIHWLRENPKRLAQLTPERFEHLVANRLEAMGMGVQLVARPNRKDGGIDLIAWPNKYSSLPFLLAGQVKHHSTGLNTGVAPVRELVGIASHAPFNAGIIVTNTNFTLDAKFFARQHEHVIKLRGFDDLVRWIKGQCLPEHEWREIPDEIEVAPGVIVNLSHIKST